MLMEIMLSELQINIDNNVIAKNLHWQIYLMITFKRTVFGVWKFNLIQI